MKNKILFIFLIFLTMLQGVNASQAGLDKEINYYAEIFAGTDHKIHKKQYDPLSISGLSSPKIFDSVAEKLEVNAKLGSKFPAAKRATLYAKILALSGNEKYRPLLVKISKYSKIDQVRQAAKASLIKLDNYAE